MDQLCEIINKQELCFYKIVAQQTQLMSEQPSFGIVPVSWILKNSSLLADFNIFHHFSKKNIFKWSQAIHEIKNFKLAGHHGPVV